DQVLIDFRRHLDRDSWKGMQNHLSYQRRSAAGIRRITRLSALGVRLSVSRRPRTQIERKISVMYHAAAAQSILCSIRNVGWPNAERRLPIAIRRYFRSFSL